MSETIHLRVLGPVEAWKGHKLALGGAQQRRILAVLVMRSGEVVSVDRDTREVVLRLAVRNEQDDVTTPGEARVRLA